MAKNSNPKASLGKRQVVDRLVFIPEKCAGKRVLDLGCIGPYAPLVNPASKIPWLHAKLLGAASHVTAVDTDEAKIKRLSEAGYEIAVGDVMNLSHAIPAQEFDVIVAGELIEHLSNPGLFLEGLKPFLKKEGELVITTPNPFHYLNPLFVLLGRPLASHTDHVAWYDEETIKTLADKHGFIVAEVYYYNYPILRKMVRVRRAIEWLLFRIEPRFAPGLGAVLQKAK